MTLIVRLKILISLLLLSCTQLKSQDSDCVPNEFLVQFNPGVSGPSWYNTILLEKRASGISNLKLLSEQLNIYQINIDPAVISEKDAFRFLQVQSNIRYVQRNHYIKWRNAIPNDSLFSQQYYLQNKGQTGGTIGLDIKAAEAWNVTQGGVTPAGDTIVVCVIDNGVDIDHPDLKENIWVNRSEIPNNKKDDDGNGYVDDYYGWNVDFKSDEVSYINFHGTPVAGLIGASGNNKIGVAGINWKVKLMIVTSQIANVLSESRAIEAYSYPLKMRQLYNLSKGKNGAFVVATNTSWGIDKRKPEDFPIWCNFYNALGEAGILNVAATINQSIDVDAAGDIPTTCPSDFMIAATAISDKGELRYGFGKKSIDITSLGFNLITTADKGAYARQSGNSFVSPQIAGAIGLLYASPCPTLAVLSRTEPAAAALYVRRALLSGVTILDSLAQKVNSGGVLNMDKSIKYLIDSCGKCPPLAKIEVTNLSTSSVQLSWITNDSIKKIDLFYRKKGDADWISLSQNNPLIINNLAPCQDYQLSFNRSCLNQESGTQLFTFQTDGCCKNPPNLENVFIGNSELTLKWDKITIATGYVLRWKLSKDSLGWQSIQVIQNGATIKNLLSCSEYDFQIRSLCDLNQLSFSNSFKITTTGCGNCLEKNYCIPKGITIVSAENEWISQVKIGDFIHLTKKDGYGDFTRKVGPILKPGVSYPLTLEPGYLNTAYDEYFIVWIDLNQDGSFTNDEELFNSGSPKKGIVNTIINIPLSAKLGSTRMRVVMQYRQEPGACVFPVEFFGEVEDYCVNLSNAVNIAPLLTNSNILVYPNPNTGSFLIDFQQEHQWETVTLINGMGQNISSITLEKGTTQFQWEAKKLNSGTYTLIFRSQKGVYAHRISVL
ncbi:MAG: T9SS C-terminal target domain-containing protein [Bacteroidetes bacterium]|nr:T9SS C-terminal target domain-containing protein [Bacteroidota bacterium]